jgi:hypothetical protein
LANLIDLTKKVEVVLEKNNLVGVKADVILAQDISGSMSGEFYNGTVQEVITRLLAVGMKMDVDKSIDVFAFNTGSRHIGEANEGNHANFVKDVFLRKVSVGGGTNYAPVMQEIIANFGTAVKPKTITREVPAKGFLGKLFGKTETITEQVAPDDLTAQKTPKLVFFITDGENWDHAEAEHVVREAAKQGIFWQFIGLGNETFDFLESLDDMEGRYIDNANFFQVNDINRISDEELYQRILGEFPSWLTEAKQKGLVL